MFINLKETDKEAGEVILSIKSWAERKFRRRTIKALLSVLHQWNCCPVVHYSRPPFIQLPCTRTTGMFHAVGVSKTLTKKQFLMETHRTTMWESREKDERIGGGWNLSVHYLHQITRRYRENHWAMRLSAVSVSRWRQVWGKILTKL